MDTGYFSKDLTRMYKLQFSQKTFQKPIDKTEVLCYNITVVKNNTNHLGV